jgi:hypothetical protein
MTRAPFHDYTARCIYHITVCKSALAPAFGRLTGQLPDINITKTVLGQIIEKEIRLLPELSPNLRLLQYVIMPDHIHLLLFVTERTDRPLGVYIGKMKVRIGQKYREITNSELSVFEKNFDDRILYRSRSLDTIYRYIRENPYRLAVRRENPQFFSRINSLTLCGRHCQAYGNILLLKNPFKEQVVIHRADSAERRVRMREQWLHTADNGGVLVSPFISQAEKQIRDAAMEINGKLIIIRNGTFAERYKPSGKEFELCADGRLLIIASDFGPSEISRAGCLNMNSFAETLANGNEISIESVAGNDAVGVA